MVHAAIHNKTKQKFAVKTYEKFRLIDQAKRRSLSREIAALEKLDHVNIVKLV